MQSFRPVPGATKCLVAVIKLRTGSTGNPVLRAERRPRSPTAGGQAQYAGATAPASPSSYAPSGWPTTSSVSPTTRRSPAPGATPNCCSRCRASSCKGLERSQRPDRPPVRRRQLRPGGGRCHRPRHEHAPHRRCQRRPSSIAATAAEGVGAVRKLPELDHTRRSTVLCKTLAPGRCPNTIPHSCRRARIRIWFGGG